MAPPAPRTAPALSFVEIVLVGDDGSPIAGERVTIMPANGEIRRLLTDDTGRVRIEGLAPGVDCEIGFPDLDGAAWERLT
jgi:hypothetical protein